MIPPSKRKKEFIELVVSTDKTIPKNEVTVIEFDTINSSENTQKIKKEENSIMITGEVTKVLIHAQVQVNDASASHYIYIYKNDIRMAAIFTSSMLVDIFKILECKKGDVFNIRMYSSAPMPLIKSKDWTFFDVQILD